MLVATRAKDEVLAGWRHDAMLRMAVIFALTAIIGVIGFYLVRQLFLGQRMAAGSEEGDLALKIAEVLDEASQKIERL